MIARTGHRKWPRAALFPLLGVLLATSGLMLSGCASSGYRTPIKPPPGFIYSEIKAPLMIPSPDIDISAADQVKVYTQTIQIPYPPYAPFINFTWGDAALEDAIRESGFTTVLYADYSWMTILGIYNELRIHVHGT